MRMSIRLRLTLWYSAVLLAGLALFSGIIWFTVGKQLLAGVDARLEQRLATLAGVMHDEEAANPTELREELREYATASGGFTEIRNTSGTLLPGRYLRDGDFEPGTRTVERDGHRLRMRAAHQNGYDAVVASSLDEMDSLLSDLRSFLLWMIPLDLAVAFLGGYWLSRRSLAPVIKMTGQAAAIGEGTLAARLDVPATGDEVQHLAESFNGVLERLEASVSRIRQFTADASHELRTPVTLIQATAELALRRERPAQQYRDALFQIEQEAQRMGALTESLLTLARADAAELDMPLAATDVNRVVKEVVQGSAAKAESRRVLVQAALPERPMLTSANEAGLRRLLLILVDNALKHTPAGGVVTVEALPDDLGVSLAVRDNGTGIPRDALPHIFERFYSADTSHGSEGAGLGLSIAQAIAQAHGSEIAVESEPGRGSKFWLTLRKR